MSTSFRHVPRLRWPLVSAPLALSLVSCAPPEPPAGSGAEEISAAVTGAQLDEIKAAVAAVFSPAELVRVKAALAGRGAADLAVTAGKLLAIYETPAAIGAALAWYLEEGRFSKDTQAAYAQGLFSAADVALLEDLRFARIDPNGSTSEAPPTGHPALPIDVAALPGEFEAAGEVMVSPFDASFTNDQRAELRKLVTTLTGHADVTLLVPADADLKAEVDALVALGAVRTRLKAVRTSQGTGRAWVRDYGPVAVKTKASGVRIVDPRYFKTFPEDDRLPAELAMRFDLPLTTLEIEHEGGNLLSDGAGRCLTTERLLLANAERYDIRAIRYAFKRAFGCQTLIVLPKLANESTGHVDVFAHVHGPAKALVGRQTDLRILAMAVNAARLDLAAKILQTAGFTVGRVPMVSNLFPATLQELYYPLSYLNAIPLPGALVMPVYPTSTSDAAAEATARAQARAAFAAAYPGRTIVEVTADALGRGRGAAHCVSLVPFQKFFGVCGVDDPPYNAASRLCRCPAGSTWSAATLSCSDVGLPFALLNWRWEATRTAVQTAPRTCERRLWFSLPSTTVNGSCPAGTSIAFTGASNQGEAPGGTYIRTETVSSEVCTGGGTHPAEEKTYVERYLICAPEGSGPWSVVECSAPGAHLVKTFSRTLNGTAQWTWPLCMADRGAGEAAAPSHRLARRADGSPP